MSDKAEAARQHIRDRLALRPSRGRDGRRVWPSGEIDLSTVKAITVLDGRITKITRKGDS